MSHDIERIRESLLHCVHTAGDVLLHHFGRVTDIRQKGEQSSVVSEADHAAEACILAHIRSEFPDHDIIAEESGGTLRQSDYTWVVDPLDGTSNYVAGLPWFGVQIAVLHRDQPVVAAMYLPTSRTLYSAELGKGAFRDGERLQVTRETKLKDVLCAFGLDPDASDAVNRANVDMLRRVLAKVRNVRTTNCLLDFCYTADGRFGGCVNLKAKIWDIAPVLLILPEAGGRMTDPQGNPIVLHLNESDMQRDYAVLGASLPLYPDLLAATRTPQGVE